MDQFFSKLRWDDLAEVAAPFFRNDRASAESFLCTLQSEARLGLTLVKPHLKPGLRVLEVGAGMGLLSAYLQSQGVDIVALEPGLGGFGISAALAKAANFKNLERLEVPVQHLGDLAGRRFDLIYSINVLEHIPQLRQAIRGMARVLGDGGLMVHTCPNYLVPFEPHFGILLVPLRPRLTQVLRPQLKESDLWQSLCFVTVPELRRIAEQEGLSLRFERGTLRRAFERLDSDPAFRERQARGLVNVAYRALKATGTLRLLEHFPVALSTPMIFQLRRVVGL